MPFQYFTNNGYSTINGAILPTDATINVQTGHGARFPELLGNPAYWRATLDSGTGSYEVVQIVARPGSDQYTALRGIEGTAPMSWASGTKFELRLTSDSIRYQRDHALRMACFVRPHANVASYQVAGTTLYTRVGSHIAATLTNSSFRGQNPRIRLTCGNSAQIGIDNRVAQPCMSIANGFEAAWRFGFATIPNSSHFFLGFINTTGAVASVHPPTSMSQMIGVGWANAGSLQGTFLNLYWNAAGTATYASLGSYFSINTQAWYEFWVRAIPNVARLEWGVRRLDISSIADVSSYLTANIPGNSLWLSPRIHGTSMVTSALAVEDGGVTWWS